MYMAFNRFCFLLAVGLLLLTSCKKDNGFGSSLLPGDDTIGLLYDDSTDLIVSSVYEAPLRTDRLLFNFLGGLQSPVFGNVSASNIIEVTRPAIVLPDSLGPYILKSVVLNLFYDRHFGDTTEPVNWEVTMLRRPITRSIIYKSDYVADAGTQVIGRLTNPFIQPNTPQKFSEDDTTSGQLRLLQFKLDDFVGFSVINQMKSATLTIDSIFRNYFPGILIKAPTADAGKVMLQMNHTDALAGIYIYMKNGAGQDVAMILPVATSTFLHTGFQHRYQGSQVAAAASSTIAGREKAYIQAQAGVKTMVRIQNPERFKGKLINKAILEIYEVEEPAINTPRPRTIFPLRRSSDGKNESLIDYSAAFYGPAPLDTLTEGSDGKKIVRYRINISNYMKQLALGKEQNNGIYLAPYPLFDLTPGFILQQASIVQPQYIEPSAVVIGGPDYSDPQKQMKLKVWYSLPK
jgi:hypothetical protein